jgi:hypothetical protein
MSRAYFNASSDSFAVEGMGTSGAEGIAPDAAPQEPDPDWQPL